MREHKPFINYLKTLTKQPEKIGDDISENRHKIPEKSIQTWFRKGWFEYSPFPEMKITASGLIIFNAVLTVERKKKDGKRNS